MNNRSIPQNIPRDELLACLRTIVIDDSVPFALAPYVEQDLDRFLLTYNLAHIEAKDVLEIGANPYFLTLLLKWFRPELNVEMINFFGQREGTFTQHVSLSHALTPGLPTDFEMRFASADIETQRIPHEDDRFDLVFFCEVLEHFIVDPFHALVEIQRVLRVGGHVVLSTPNVARLENLARMLAGQNIYDPYSGHGPHGRHNREYTRHEVAWLLTSLGFVPVTHFTDDVHAIANSVDWSELQLPPGREHDLGQYQFHLWKKDAALKNGVCRPAWLYRSMNEPLDEKPL